MSQPSAAPPSDVEARVDQIKSGGAGRASRGTRHRTSRFAPFKKAREHARSLNLKGKSEWYTWAKSAARPADIPSHPDRRYKDEGWGGWGDWLGTGAVSPKDHNWRPFEQAREYARSVGLRTQNEWLEWAKSGDRPLDIPRSPKDVYKNKGWRGWGDWLGTGAIGPKNYDFWPFQQARHSVRSCNLKNMKEWSAWSKSASRPANIPSNPNAVYKNQGWVSWSDWLGTYRTYRGTFRSFKEARAFAHSRSLKGKSEWSTWAKSADRPPDIPSNPDTYYKHEGWVSWGDWLGTGTVASFDQTFWPLVEARVYARSLNLQSLTEWREWSKSGARPAYIPAAPHHVYESTGWIGYGDWLGTGQIRPKDRVYLPFEEARSFARSLNLESHTEWREWAKSEAHKHKIPANPASVYKNQGWLGWDDWLREDAVDAPRLWTVWALRRYVASLGAHLASMTPAELYVLFQQNGLLTSQHAGRRFAKAVVTGTVPPAEIEKFAKGEPSQLDVILLPNAGDTPAGGAAADIEPGTEDPGTVEIDPDKDLTKVVVHGGAEAMPELPFVETATALAALGRVASSADAEAVEFLIASAVRKMWTHAFRDEGQAVEQANQASDSEYAQQAAQQFLSEYYAAKHLPIPAGYAFRGLDRRPSEPHLMQRLIATQVQIRRRVGNWSGTGAGKTLAAVLASRVVDAGLTVVMCPNSVADVWASTIRNAFPDSDLTIKLWDTPEPRTNTGFEARGHRYLVLNYEMFQQPDSAQHVRRLVEREPIDMLVIDEVQAVKNRDPAQLSLRRKNVAMLVSQAGIRNSDLRVLGMSATPVVNNLQEGKSLVELITGIEHPELPTQPTLNNCMKLHQRLVTLGIREQPNYDMGLTTVAEQVDVSDALPDIRALGSSASPLDLERILTRARLPVIQRHVKKGTLIYTELLDGIEKQLRNTVRDAGFSVGSFTGEDKTGLAAFLRGEIDVLIGSSAISTGVDGLQAVCDTLILNVLPWTAAQYDQIKGRVYRQGQQSDVTVVLPLTFATVNGERWSWCDSKMQRLEFKRSIADAAVDGVVPIGHLRSQQQALKDQLGWLKRLEEGEVETISRPRLLIPLPPADADEDERRRARYGEFSLMNNRINVTHSTATHQRMQANPDEWGEYHSRYREKRRDWPLVPFEELIRYYADEQGLVIGDFGCGEADLGAALSDRHIVHSFDHVAINDSVIACDVAHTPLEQASLDVAIFSLSLMGSNFADYVREAARVLKRDRVLHIYEATTRFGSTPAEVEANRRAFRQSLRDFGFDVVDMADRWKFTYVKAMRSGRAPLEDATIAFKHLASESRELAAD
jgi:hypothetical protein